MSLCLSILVIIHMFEYAHYAYTMRDYKEVKGEGHVVYKDYDDNYFMHHDEIVNYSRSFIIFE